MQIMITFVLLFSLRTLSLATDVTVYDRYDYDHKELQELVPNAVSQFPWKFGYFKGDDFHMNIHIRNKPPSVTAINVTYQLDDGTSEMKKYTQEYGQRKGEEYYYFGKFIKSTEINIKINLYQSNILCSSVLVGIGRDVEKITNKTLKEEFQYCDICFANDSYCLLLVDLKEKCDGITELQLSQNPVSIYVIPSVIGMCVIILVIYLIRVKKYCHRNSHPVETMELNTYSSANEVVYADLGFVHGDSQPPRRDEESTYAQIIGVLKPVDGNVNNK